MRKRHVLVADEDAAISRLLMLSLKGDGFQVTSVSSGNSAISLLGKELFDLVILGIPSALPGITDICRLAGGLAKIPVILVNDNGDVRFKARCLEMGADDYITKPFSVEELMARVRSALRRSIDTVFSAQNSFSFGTMNIHFSGRRVAVNGVEIKLTPTEYTLLQELVANANRVITHRALLQKVWGMEYADEREYLRVFVNRLRRKIWCDREGDRWIVTVRGVGYSFLPQG